MKILFLYNNELALKLAKQLEQNQHEVVLWSDKIDIELLKKIEPDKIISYSYIYIISREVIEFMSTPILNLHISYLPWNRGKNPNFWSFVDDTPKGVTIHQIDERLDKGKILLQKRLQFDENKETFVTTYQKLNEEIVKLFMENCEPLLHDEIEGTIPTEKGTYHSGADFEKYTEHNTVKWEDVIGEYKKGLKG